jgi:hypothetical protein
MKNFRILFLLILLVMSCGPIKQIPVETIINYKDSTVVNTIDSVIYIPKERIVDVVAPYDTLKLETNMAKAEAYVDTTLHLLKGSIENKKGVTEKIKYKEKLVYRDSVVTKEVPVEVPVEVVKHKHYWYEPILWLFALLSIGYIGLKLAKKYLIKI